MNIGELFLNLGIKGSEKTLGALTDVKKGLSDTASMSLEAKAAIVGTVYAFEQLMSASGRAGTDLSNFNAVTGVTTKTLQEYQYAGRQVGVSNETTANSFKTLQNAMANAAIGKAPPAGLAQLAHTIGGIKENYKELAAEPEKLFQYAQKYAQTEKNIPLRNQVLKSFGFDDSLIAGLSKNAFRPDVFQKAPTYSDREIGQLDHARAAWSNLGNSIEMAVGHFNALHGVQIVKDLTAISTQVIHLVGALESLAEKIGLFQNLAHAMEGLANTFKLVNEAIDKFQGKESKKGDLLYTPPGKEMIPGLSNSPAGKFFKGLFQNGNNAPGTSNFPIPGDSKLYSTPKNQNNTISVTNNFAHPGVNPKQTEHSTKKAVRDAFRQLPQGGST